MRRTNIYLTERQQASLDARAAAAGSTRSDVVRTILDAELGLQESDPSLDEALASCAGEIAEIARRLAADDPDLSIET